MDKKTVILAVAAASTALLLAPKSYADLLKPIQNPIEALKSDNARIQLADYWQQEWDPSTGTWTGHWVEDQRQDYYHHHHHHHHHAYHHHHHHHHYHWRDEH